MSDEIAENGTTNGDVPEIELIIKVELAVCNTCCERLAALHFTQPQPASVYLAFAAVRRLWKDEKLSDVINYSAICRPSFLFSI